MSDPKETPPVTMSDWQKINSLDAPIAPEDDLQVFLNGKLHGAVLVANATEGYIVKRSWCGAKVTLKGEVKILFNGEEAAKAEIDQGGQGVRS